MKQYSRLKSTRFWIGVILIVFSTFFWFIAVITSVVEGNATTNIGIALFYTSIPIGIGILCISPRSITLKSPWGSGTLVTASILGTLAAGGVIAGLNWHRLGRHRLVWPTAILPIIVYIAALYLQLPETLETYVSFSIAITISVGFALAVWFWQRENYRVWKELNPDAQRAGWQIPLLAILVFQAVSFGFVMW